MGDREKGREAEADGHEIEDGRYQTQRRSSRRLIEDDEDDEDDDDDGQHMHIPDLAESPIFTFYDAPINAVNVETHPASTVKDHRERRVPSR